VTTTWFTSDTHFGHTNILKYCGRPFETVEAMDEALITGWNERVKPGDLVYHLGDFALVRPDQVQGYVKRLHGQIQLIHGNHDRFLKDKKRDFGFSWIGPYKEIKIDGQAIVLCHYPFVTWRSSYRGSWALHGHTHQRDPISDPTVKRMNVGVDAWAFRPVSFEEVVKEMSKVKWVPKDHHDL